MDIGQTIKTGHGIYDIYGVRQRMHLLERGTVDLIYRLAYSSDHYSAVIVVNY